MKRVRFLAVIMVAALMMMGVGYAAWTDQITMEATVNTGTFDVQFDDTAEACKVEFTGTQYNGADVAKVGEDFAFSDENDKATVTIENLYPGAEGNIYLKVENYSSIPAKFKGASVSIDTANFEDHFLVKGLYNLDGGTSYNPAVDSWTKVDSFGTQMSLTSNPLMNEVLAPATISGTTAVPSADGDLYLKIPFKLADDEDGAPAIGAEEHEGETIVVTIDFDWQQWNV